MKKSIFLGMAIYLITTDVFAQLLAYYPFNGSAIDATNHGYDGKLVNVSLATDRFGNSRKAYRFDGKGYIFIENAFFANKEEESEAAEMEKDGDAVEDAMETDTVPSEEKAKLTGITIALWLYPKEHKAALLFHSTKMTLFLDEGNTIWFQTVQANNLIKLNEWQHLVVTLDAFDNVDIYRNGIHINGGSSAFTYPQDDKVTLGGSLVGQLDDVRIYDTALSALEVKKLYQEEKPATAIQNQSVGSYEEGYEAGRQSCIQHPESCGIRLAIEEHDEKAVNTVASDNKDIADKPLLECHGNVQTVVSELTPSQIIVSIPFTSLQGNHTINLETVQNNLATTGELALKLKSHPSHTPQLTWNVKVNPLQVQAGEAQLLSWQSRDQTKYFISLHDLKGMPINTSTYLTETCKANNSNGADGCLGYQTSTQRCSDSWTIPASLKAGQYQIRLAVWHTTAKTLSENYSPPFTVK